MATQFYGTPGINTGGTLSARTIVTNGSASQLEFVPGFYFIDGTNSRDTGNAQTNLIRAGVLLGKITSTGLYRPSILGLTTATFTTTGTNVSVTVAASVATEVARLITNAAGNVSLKLIGPPTAAGTVAITAVTASAASGTTITITADPGVSKIVGTIVAPADGSQIPLVPLFDPYGVDVVDVYSNSINQPLGQYLRGADLNSIMIPGLITDDFGQAADTSVTAWIKSQLILNSGFTFSDSR